MWRPFSRLCLLLLFIAPGVAFAQGEEEDFFDLGLEELVNVKVSVATRTEDVVSQLPSTVTVYTRQEIRNMGISTLEGLLNYVPGAQTARNDEDGRAYTPSFRGRRVSSSARDVLILLDGLRLNDPVRGGAFNQESQLTLEHVKQVEIIRGPGSALYGANAFAGVINIITDRESTEATVRGGSLEAREVYAQGSYNGSWQGSLFGRYYQDSGQTYEPFLNYFGTLTETQDPQRGADVYGTFSVAGLGVRVRYAHRRYDDFVSGGAQENGFQKQEATNLSFAIDYQWELTPTFTLKPYADYYRGKWDHLLGIVPAFMAQSVWWATGDSIPAIGGNIRTIEQKRAGLDAQWKLHTHHTLLLGATYRSESMGLNPFQGNWDAEHIERTGGELIPAPPGDIQSGFWMDGMRFDLLTPNDRDVMGIYAQDQWQINTDLNMTVGARLDYYDDFGSKLSLRGGLVYQFRPMTTFKVLYGEAFRAPTFQEARAGIASGGVGNPDLKPETIRTIEVAWLQRVRQTQWVLTGFFSHIDDEVGNVLVEDIVEGFTAQQPQNVGSSNLSGLELEVNSSLTEHLFLRAGISGLIQSDSGQPIAENTAFLILNYRRGRWNFNLNGYYHDEVLSRSADGEIYQKDIILDRYMMANAAMRYQITDWVEALLNVKNLTDKQFRTYSNSSEGLAEGIPSRGRRFMIGLRTTL